MLVVKPHTMSSGAVSPMTRAMASVTPVVSPASEGGSTILRMVNHYGTPSAYEASRSSLGTSRRISSLHRTHPGHISPERAPTPITPARKAGQQKGGNGVGEKSPATIEGIP